MKKLFSLAFNSFKEVVRQPFYYILLFSGCFILFMSFMFTFFAFGEELRMVKDMAISTITLCGLLTGILSSSVLITNEFKRKTILALLCKPVTRVQIVLGKFFGIAAAVIVLIFLQATFLEVLIKLDQVVGFSNLEPSLGMEGSSQLLDSYCLQGIYFSLLQVLMLTSISVILSVYLNVSANLITCFAVFILSHIISYLFTLIEKAPVAVNFVVKICYVVFPNFWSLNIFAMNSISNEYVPLYIFYASLYSVLYCIIVLWLATFCFERKEFY
ncbi:MAG: ABC transporter permease [Candidatus Scalindua sp.]|nr:ABC transporter permease [Candidatus Scalindua sp.]